MSELDISLTQGEFGELVGISQQAVGGLLQRGVIFEGGTGREWLMAYCDHLREIAAGRGGEEGIRLNLENTRATIRGKQVDIERKELALAEKRKALMPTQLLEQILGAAGARVARILDTIPSQVREHLPQLGAADIKVVSTIVARARNIAAAVRMSDLEIDFERVDSAANADDDEAVAAAEQEDSA